VHAVAVHGRHSQTVRAFTTRRQGFTVETFSQTLDGSD
jgi:hypothetical protein